MSQEDMQAAAAQIAAQLGETEAQPLQQIAGIVQHCGLDFAQAVLKETFEIEAQGGMMLANNSRRRTVGGVFFYLARNQMPKAKAKLIFPNYFKRKPAAERTPELPSFQWANRIEIVRALLDDKGDASTVKITLIGRPGRLDKSTRDVVITTMTHSARPATLPKGVPTPPEKPTLYTVYIAAKQWRKVEESITDPDDMLIIEGICAFDDKLGGMAVFAMNVTTKLLEAKKRQEQKERSASQTGEPSSTPKAANEPAALPPVPAATVHLPGAPADVNQKLNELHSSAALFRQKVAALQAKPENQRFGLEMTQKLLKNVEDEIAQLVQKYGSG